MIAELNKYHGLPNGMFSCDEHLAGLDPSQGSELCTVVEYMFSLEQSLAISGDACARRPAGEAGLQRAARHVHRRHVGAPVQPGTKPGGVQPAPQALDHRRAGIESLRTGAEFRLLHGQFPPGMAEVHQPACSCFPARERMTRRMVWSPRRTLPAKCTRCFAALPVHVVEETNYPFRGTVRLTSQSRVAVELSAAVPHSGMGCGRIDPGQRRSTAGAAAGLICARRANLEAPETASKLRFR